MDADKEKNPPLAEIKPRKLTIHGEEIIDNYYWLREKDNPEVIAYLEAENTYTEKMMKHAEELQEQLFSEIRSRIKEDDQSAPEKAGEYHYFSRTVKDKQYRMYYRKKNDREADEELILDQNELANGQEYHKIGFLRISPNHKLLAYAEDTNGYEKFTIRIKNLKTGELLEDTLINASDYLEWADDSKTFFYTVLNAVNQPDKVYRHVLGTDPANGELVYQEKDGEYYLFLTKTRDDLYFLITLKSKTTSEVHYLPVNTPEEKFRVINPRKHGLEYYVEHCGRRFFIRTNDKAKNFRLMEAPVEKPARENWKEIIPHRKTTMLADFEVFENHLVLHEREDGLTKINVINLETSENYYVDFPEPVYTCWSPDDKPPSVAKPEFKSNLLRFNYSSLKTPESVFDYDMDTKERKLVKQEEILGGYDPDKYETERIKAKAADGTKVYISLVYKKGTIKDGKNPLLLYGYGSYGYSIDPQFLSHRISLLDRGVIYSIAHIRGGSELGRHWYEQGKMLNKKNTFTDFITCAEHLINEKYTSSEKLAVLGGSAGGLLIGAAVNMKPELFKAAVAVVPFVDVINTMLDASIPLTELEYEEWGNPQEKKYYDYMKSYSPYDNVEAKNYPNLLIRAGLNDPRVQYWEPAKWTAKLRAMKTDCNLLLLKTDMSAGHSGKSGRYEALREVAFYYAFVLDQLGYKN
ncbi:MAG: S9 family peptidase [Candidatus Odinarchaeota archaeon]